MRLYVSPTPNLAPRPHTDLLHSATKPGLFAPTRASDAGAGPI